MSTVREGMKHNTCAAVTVLLFTLVVILRPGLARGSRAAPLIAPVTRTWRVDPDRESRAGIDAGLAARLRYAETENMVLLGAEPDPGQDFTRIKMQAWLEGWFSPSIKCHIKFNSERKYYHNCESCLDWGHEIIIESLYLEAVDLLGAPVGMRLGRQNLFYGDGFIIADGSPLDGSRTAYVNAALFTFAIPQWAFDVFLVSDHEQDDYLPKLDDEDKPLVETDHCLMGVYFRNMPYGSGERTYTFEPYFIIKREKVKNGLDRISTFGTRFAVPIARTLARAEATYQMGKRHEDYEIEEEAKNISAFGGSFYFDATFEQFWNLEVGTGYVYLAGDNPKTHGKYEGWNPVLGRWPQWSELYIYMLIPEGGVAYWQNIKFPLIRGSIEPYPGFTFDASYYWMYANQPESRKRGDLYTLMFGYRIGKYIFGHVLYEHFSPGNFYDYYWRELGISGEPKEAHFLRFEFSFSI
jgi:hypothetical protein